MHKSLLDDLIQKKLKQSLAKDDSLPKNPGNPFAQSSMTIEQAIQAKKKMWQKEDEKISAFTYEKFKPTP
jgi:hypothetical protein